MRFPLKLPLSHLGDLYETANRLIRDESYRTLYRRFMEEYEELGHLVKAPSASSADGSHYYLPHHVVLNASAKTTLGYSVNDHMYTSSQLTSLRCSDRLLYTRTTGICNEYCGPALSSIQCRIGSPLSPTERSQHPCYQTNLFFIWQTTRDIGSR